MVASRPINSSPKASALFFCCGSMACSFQNTAALFENTERISLRCHRPSPMLAKSLLGHHGRVEVGMVREVLADTTTRWRRYRLVEEDSGLHCATQALEW